MVATRWVLVLILSLFGVFASLTEVNAGRFCRKATACPCVQAAPCVPTACVPVEVATCVPLEGVACAATEYIPVTYRTFATAATVGGKFFDGSGVPKLLTNVSVTVTVKAVLTPAPTTVAESVVVSQAFISSSATYFIDLSPYTIPANQSYYVEFKRTGGSTIVRYGPYPSGSSQVIYPQVPTP